MKILVVKPYGIGNMVMLTPAIKALRKLYPNDVIDLIGYTEGIEVVEGCGEISNYFMCKVEVNEGDYDIVIYSSPRSFEFDYPEIPKQIKWEKEDYFANEIERNLQLVSRLGDIGDFKQYKPFVCLNKESELWSKQTLHRKGFKGHTIIGIHTGAKVEFDQKKWFNDYWKNLIQMILDKGWRVVIVGSSNEVNDINEILNSFKNNKSILNFVEKTTIKQTMSLITNFTVMVSTDSGPMHLASALQVPVIGLFGCTVPSKNAPWGEKSKVIYRKVLDCQPCYVGHFNCDCDFNKCMFNIKPKEVFGELNALVEKYC